MLSFEARQIVTEIQPAYCRCIVAISLDKSTMSVLHTISRKLRQLQPPHVNFPEYGMAS